jgi:hypothetical protein
MDSFMQRLAKGEVKSDDIDDAIEEWHSSSVSHGIQLYEFLGMTWSEYAAFLECRLTPQQILNGR